MRISEELLVVDTTPSTQGIAAAKLLDPNGCPGAILALEQTEGRGRFDRAWHSEAGSSLTMSLVLPHYADHPKVWFVGMAVAAACAGVIHSQIRWPNDLTLAGKKLGGILTQIYPDRAGRRVPVVGIGINIGPLRSLPPELIDQTTSLIASWPKRPEAEVLARRILARVREIPDPYDWNALAPIWNLFDDTAGKHYKLPNGAKAVALGVGPGGELLCSVDGDTRSVLAADALFLSGNRT